MACRYCFYHELAASRETPSFGLMSEQTLETLVRETVAYADGFAAFAFQGGEPTAAGLDFYRKTVKLQKKYNDKGLTIENTIQTNGLLIDDEWADFLAENRFLTGLSLDGPKELHDRFRRDCAGKPTFTRVLDAARRLAAHGADFNILTVVTDETAKHARLLYDFYKRSGFMYVQLIPCMDELSRRGDARGKGLAVSPHAYGRFLCEMFDLWYEDFRRGLRMDIRMFSNLAQMAAGYPAEQCGMNGQCSCYFVVEGDGSVYPCDFYCTDEWRLGSVGESFTAMISSDRAREFVVSSRPVSPECRQCPHFYLCRGGCRRWREPFIDGIPALNRLCPAYKMFFSHASERIRRLGMTILDPSFQL